VAFDIASPFLKTKNDNRYILVAIDHSSKWREPKVMVNHDVERDE
jgi:hypothetical protein